MHGYARRSLAVLCCSLTLLAACGGKGAAEYVRRGNTYFDQARFPEAILEFRNALQIDPRLGEVRRKLGQAYLRDSDGDAALHDK